MSTLERIFKRIAPEPKKQMLKAKLKQGYIPTPMDKKNLTILMKRNFNKDINPDIGDVELLKLFLHMLYAKEVKAQRQDKNKKKDSKTKLNELIKILEESEVKRTNMGSHFVKLVK